MKNTATNLSDCDFDWLSPGHTLLYGQYKIEQHLIGGGFGMTYLARDSLDRIVVIKECFPSTICRRVNGEVRPHKIEHQEPFQKVILSFLREALRMAKFDHPNIVKVHQVFQENNTAYIAMDFVDGMDLLTMLEVDPGRITDAMIETLLRDTLSALDYVHGMGMLHRDISPDNLLTDANDKLTIIDFGAAREEIKPQTRAHSYVMAVKDGYSPHEFYYTDGEQKPSSDIYSVGATFYHLITGSPPPDCQKRVAALTSDMPDPYKPLVDGNWAFDAAFLSAIDKALFVPQKDRFESAQAWLDHLDNAQPNSSTVADDASSEMAESAFDTPAHPIAVTSSPPQKDTEVEVELALDISSLVQDTNTKLKAPQPKEQINSVPEVNEKPAPLVDIFGQPIEDLEKWLKEQDEKPWRKRALAASDSVTQEQPEHAYAEASEPRLLRLFRKLSRMRHGATT
ncbi:serine/threonine protein kinase [Roseovarius aestuariivivens]|uniref:serine/threonine protein kinase n=1 Tax=Roseovarius aestuariivivens TaxID=1888910 RepID=UPI001080DA9F|nr:serine/threonine-protein kinase [Roseovarius aestuariivivens]